MKSLEDEGTNMIDVQSEIDRITNNSLPPDELLECLDSSFPLVRANAILSIARRQLNSADIIEKLVELARQPGVGRLMGTLTCSRLAAAALHWIDTTESKREYDCIVNELDERERDDLEQVVRDGLDALS